MTKIKFISLLILLFVFGINNSFAQKQKKTAYEKKVSQIKNKYEERMSRMVLAGGGRIVLEGLMFKMKKELKDAEKLKTKVDFQREKKKRIEEEKRKEQERIEEEKREKQEEYENSDFRIIFKGVKSSFAKWNKKGEFEKKEDFYNRLRDKSKEKFVEICINEIKNRISFLWKRIENGDKYAFEDVGTYDSEKEFFPISFKVGKHVWKTTINVPIGEAKNFKNEVRWTMGKFGIIDNQLFPTVIALKHKEVYKKLNVSLKGLTGINISFDELGIDNEFLKGYVFTPNEKEKREEQERIEQEKRKEQEKIEQERRRIERERQKKQEKYKNSDYVKILEAVKSSFAKWNKKGELEKKERYNKRLRKKSKKKFDEICTYAIQDRFNELVPPVYIYEFVSMKVGTYDSQKESLPISFKVKEHIWKTNVNIPSDKVSYIKRSKEFSFDRLGIIDNELFPTVISLEYPGGWGYKTLTLNVNLKGLTEISIPFDELGIDNEFLRGYVFTFEQEFHWKPKK